MQKYRIVKKYKYFVIQTKGFFKWYTWHGWDGVVIKYMHYQGAKERLEEGIARERHKEEVVYQVTV